MKSLSQKKSENKNFKVQSNSINYIDAEQLKKYLKVANNFIGEDTKELINWLIVNNDTYISELSTDDDENALAGFYKSGEPAKDNLKELYKLLKNIIKENRAMEIPVFQTKEQFENIINKKVPADTIILDLDSEKGRAAVSKKYEPLIHKICHQWVGKINLPYDDLVGFAYEGLTYAMNNYGKKNKKSKATDDAVLSYTFGQFAAYCILNQIKGNGVYASHLVKISASQQKKERKEKGHNTKSFSLSGDKVVGHNDEGSKTLFDFIGSAENSSNDLDRQDLEKLLSEAYKILEKNFSEKTMEIWYSFYGVNGHKQLSNKELAKRYNVAGSNISYYCYKVNAFILKNKEILDKFKEIKELMNECLNDIDRDNDMRGTMVTNSENIDNEE